MVIYIRGTIEVGLLYDPFEELSVGVISYMDSNFIDDRDKRQYITVYLFGFGGKLES